MLIHPCIINHHVQYFYQVIQTYTWFYGKYWRISGNFGKETSYQSQVPFLESVRDVKNDSVPKEKRWQRCMQICFWPSCSDGLKMVVQDRLPNENPKIAFYKLARFVYLHPTILQRCECPVFRFFLHCGTLPCCRMSRSTHASQTHSFGNPLLRMQPVGRGIVTSDCTPMSISCWITPVGCKTDWLELSPNTFRLGMAGGWKACPVHILYVFSWVWGEDCSLTVLSHWFPRKHKQRWSHQCDPPCFNIGSCCFLICTSAKPRSDFHDSKEIRCNESRSIFQLYDPFLEKSSDAATLKKDVERTRDDVLHIPGIPPTWPWIFLNSDLWNWFIYPDNLPRLWK